MKADPNVLVLGGGGILGEAWMSAVLAGLEEVSGFDPRGCGGYVGTSAGSIVAAALASGVDPRSRLGDLPEQPAVTEAEALNDGGLADRALEMGLDAARTVVAPLAAVGLRATELPGALVRRAALGAMKSTGGGSSQPTGKPTPALCTASSAFSRELPVIVAAN